MAISTRRRVGLTGNDAVAMAWKQIDPDVVAAYPITPSTGIVEKFSQYVADGDVGTIFVPVESEHSAMSACIGAAGNEAFFQLVLCAYNLLNWFKRLCAPPSLQKANLQRLRRQLFLVPAQLTRPQGRPVLRLARAYPFPSFPVSFAIRSDAFTVSNLPSSTSEVGRFSRRIQVNSKSVSKKSGRRPMVRGQPSRYPDHGGEHSMKLTRTVLVLGVGLVALVLAFMLPQSGAGQSVVAKRTIYMAAIEPKGGTSVSSEAFPTAALPQGPGYVLKQPDATGRWEISGYYWQPAFVMAYEGENVTLEILGINGAEHAAFIEGIKVSAFTVKRGQVTTVNFRAGKPGFYRIVCSSHMPTMVGYLVVLPKR